MRDIGVKPRCVERDSRRTGVCILKPKNQKRWKNALALVVLWMAQDFVIWVKNMNYCELLSRNLDFSAWKPQSISSSYRLSVLPFVLAEMLSLYYCAPVLAMVAKSNSSSICMRARARVSSEVSIRHFPNPVWGRKFVDFWARACKLS